MPNYGSYFGIASINHNDLPVPNEWLRFIRERLDPYADPINFTGTIPVPGPGVSSRPAELRAHVPGYEAAGVAYVVAPPDDNPFAPSYDSTPGKGGGRATNVARGTSAVATLFGPMPPGRARGVSVFQGNYAKHAGGRLEVRVCNARRACASGSRALSESTDNQYFQVPLDRPVSLAPQPVTVTFTTSSPDRPEALWTFPGSPDQMVAINGAPLPNAAFRLRFLYALTGTLPPAVYHDPAMTIYRLPHPRPYAEAPGCALAVRSRTEMEADCPRGAELHRLELFYPGWSARVNGRAAEIGEFDRAFQRVALPAGKSAIVFSFAPPGIGYGLAAFGAGVLALLALALARCGAAACRRRFPRRCCAEASPDERARAARRAGAVLADRPARRARARPARRRTPPRGRPGRAGSRRRAARRRSSAAAASPAAALAARRRAARPPRPSRPIWRR